MILVTGSTGKVGKEVVRKLNEAKADFAAMVRKAEDADILQAQGIRTIVGNFADPESICAALDGIEQVYLLSPVSLALVEQERTFVETAKQAGVRRIVLHSVLGADSRSSSSIFRWHGQSEEHLRTSGIGYTVLRPNGFMSNLVEYFAPTIAAEGTFRAPFADARVGYVDPRDIAAIAARVLTRSGDEGQTYTLTGPEALTHDEIAGRLTRWLGKEVTFTLITDDAMLEQMRSWGVPMEQAEASISLYGRYRAGDAAVVTDAVREMTGRKPRTLDAYLAENRKAFEQAKAAR